MKSKIDNIVTVTMTEEEATEIKEFLFWLDFSTMPIEFEGSLNSLYILLTDTLPNSEHISLYNMVLKRKSDN